MTLEAIAIHGNDPHPLGTFLDMLVDLIPEWMSHGTCSQIDPEAWFPEMGQSTRDAKKVCTTCPVQTACLQYALDNGERYGVWGGLSERERRRLGRGPSSRCRGCGTSIPTGRSAARYCPTCRES